MAVLFVVTVLLAPPVLIGLWGSWKKRQVDRQHLIAFVGFGGGLVAVVAEIAVLEMQMLGNPSVLTQAKQGVIFLLSTIGLASTIVAFVAGLFSNGLQRVMLIISGVLMGFVYLLTAFSNFGA